jgi:CheY-like chemotaxis protein
MKSKSRLPLFQYPTKVVFVDDSQSFLDSVRYVIEARPVRTFVKGVEFVDWINEWYDAHPIGLKVSANEQISNRRAVEFDLQSVVHNVLDPQRFDRPAVAIIDYSMPELNGLAVCQLIDRHPVRKVIFTGQMPESPAIDAFNKRLIDGYQRKIDVDGTQPFERLNKSIPEIEEGYFTSISEPYYLMLNDIEGTYSFLSSEPVISLVKGLKKEYRFVEHYVFGRPSGLLFLDADGRAKLMVIANDDAMRTHLELAREEGADREFVEKLAAREIIPYFPDGHLYAGEYGELEQYVRPANRCEDGSTVYYWALFDLHPNTLPGDVISFNAFWKRQ